MWVSSIYIAWPIVTFIIFAVWNKKKENLARKHGGYRKWAWGSGSGHVRIDWNSTEIPEAFRDEYRKAIPVYSLCVGVRPQS